MLEQLLEKYREDFSWFELADNRNLKQSLEKRLTIELVRNMIYIVKAKILLL